MQLLDVESALAPTAARSSSTTSTPGDGTPLRAPDRRRPGLPPPRRTLPLGLLLGIILAVVVAAVLGALKGIEVRREIQYERTAREQLLEQSLSPLAADIERAQSIEEIHERLLDFQRAYLEYGHPDHQLLVRDASGTVVTSIGSAADSHPPTGSLEARIAITSPLLEGGRGSLVGWKDAAGFNAELRKRWSRWWLDLVLTSLALIAAVEIAVYFLVGRPLGRLVGGLRRLERGYTARWDVGPGAWEIRWLAWRVHGYATELADTVLRLVRAERRGLTSTSSARGLRLSPPGDAINPQPPAAEFDAEDGDPLHESWRTEEIRRLLNTLQPDDPLAAEVAAEAWTTAATEAERLHNMPLKADLEDGALRLLEPTAFETLGKEVESLRRSRREWVVEIAARLAEALEADGVPHEIIEHRVKHVAGAWRKMQDHEIELDQVNDLFAFRIVVADEAACYLALAAIHRAFEPNPLRFKDYIAEPKANGYRSLHTSLRDTKGRLFEVQIRSVAMHREAEDGQAAHWQYRARRWGSIPQSRSSALVDRLRRVAGAVSGRRPA